MLRRSRPLFIVVAAGLVLASAPPAAAQVPAAASDPLSVFVLTFGPGDHPFFKFGHNAIWIRDEGTRTDRVYNFGTFKFDSPRLIPEFLRGRLTYWLSVSSIATTVAVYERENRSILIQELGLPAEAKRTLKARLEENARPENRAYKYDYYLDNCSTRVRDAIDRVIDGRLHAVSRGPGRLSLRDQTLRLTADVPWLYVVLDLILATSTDRPVDRWAEMFVPEELARGLRAAAVPTPEGPRPLVTSERVLFQAQRPPPLERPPARAGTFFLAGVGLGLVFLALGWGAARTRYARVALGVLVAVWGLAVGFVGVFLAFIWAFTDHVVAHQNENLLQCAPFAIALAVLGFGVAWGSRGATRLAFVLAALALLCAITGAALKLHPAFQQHNAPLIAFFVPAWLGLAAGLRYLPRKRVLM